MSPFPKNYIARHGRVYDLKAPMTDVSASATWADALTFYGGPMRKAGGVGMTAGDKADALVRMAQAAAWTE